VCKEKQHSLVSYYKYFSRKRKKKAEGRRSEELFLLLFLLLGERERGREGDVCRKKKRL
jgi:hypothetical protein